MEQHLVRYVQHVRRELLRATDGVLADDLERSHHGVNSVAWMVGHLAAQEQAYWLETRGTVLYRTLTGYRRAVPQRMDDAQTLLAQWREVTSAADVWLTGLSEDDLRRRLPLPGAVVVPENVGSLLTRVIGHYYLHIGQITVVRKMLGYPVPSFVGSQEGAYYE
ncbi:MAG: DinB family protein [Deinococcota bacterium]|jgi:uncharacterized damage-inducible protein DinB|nr:DinB family protein [Deinococcota bacterium]